MYYYFNNAYVDITVGGKTFPARKTTECAVSVYHRNLIPTAKPTNEIEPKTEKKQKSKNKSVIDLRVMTVDSPEMSKTTEEASSDKK